MTDDALERVLSLVADGRLTADEAGPILDALELHSSPEAAGPASTGAPAATPGGGPGRALRVEVTEGGRKVVNLRVPISLGRAALSRIPGLSEATTDRIREAIEAGVSGPIVAVDEGSGDGVRVILE
jgi:hypothetical protein